MTIIRCVYARPELVSELFLQPPRRRKKKLPRKARVSYGADSSDPPPTPQGPNHWPQPDKKGTNLLLFKFRIHLHSYQDLQLKRCRVMGQKLRCGRPDTHVLPGTHNWLTQPQTASNCSEFHYVMLALSWKFGVICCSFGLTHPVACTQARVPLTCGHVHRPPFTQFAQKGCLSTGLQASS